VNGGLEGSIKIWTPDGDLLSEGFYKSDKPFNGDFIEWIPTENAIFYKLKSYSMAS
jgi:antitoxin component YwqK of YwqJK toxin-antitoxin module